MSDAPVNVTQLTDSFGEDYDLLSEIYQTYLEDCEARMGELAEIVEGQDAAKCAEVAHAIKGSSANVGANAVGEIAATMEKDARAGDISNAQAHLDAIGPAFAEAKAFLLEYLNSIKP